MGILVILFLVWVTSVTGSIASRVFLSLVTSRVSIFGISCQDWVRRWLFELVTGEMCSGLEMWIAGWGDTHRN